MSTIEKNTQKHQAICNPKDTQGDREIHPKMLSLWKLMEKQRLLLDENDRHFHRFSQSKKDVIAAQDDITKAVKKLAKLVPKLTPFAESGLHLRAIWGITERWEKACDKLISTDQKMYELYNELSVGKGQIQGVEQVDKLESEVAKVIPQFLAYAKECAAASEECAAISQEMKAEVEIKKKVVEELVGVEKIIHLYWAIQTKKCRIIVTEEAIPKVLPAGK